MDGADSDAGAGYEPRLWLSCNAVRDLVDANSGLPGTDSITETGASYRVVIYANHDVQTDCSVELGAAAADSDSNYYPAFTNGATTGSCLAYVDYPPTGAIGSAVGYWRFTVESSGPRATYNDEAAHPLDGYFLGFSESECRIARALDGRWMPTTLADVFD